MTDEETVAWLNDQFPPCIRLISGCAEAFSRSAQSLRMSFTAVPEFCHSGNIMQGGFVTAMLDASMAFSLIGLHPEQWVATLEIKVSFIAPGHPGKLEGNGRVVHQGRSIAYLAGELSQEGRLVAAATSTVKRVRRQAAIVPGS
ncbi:MAG: PaaI family thioesterase [Gammaproteobacteria bacterium]|nr:PaaI family thioesterase [Gammaproteobacteria bacterium]